MEQSVTTRENRHILESTERLGSSVKRSNPSTEFDDCRSEQQNIQALINAIYKKEKCSFLPAQRKTPVGKSNVIQLNKINPEDIWRIITGLGIGQLVVPEGITDFGVIRTPQEIPVKEFFLARCANIAEQELPDEQYNILLLSCTMDCIAEIIAHSKFVSIPWMTSKISQLLFAAYQRELTEQMPRREIAHESTDRIIKTAELLSSTDTFLFYLQDILSLDDAASEICYKILQSQMEFSAFFKLLKILFYSRFDSLSKKQMDTAREAHPPIETPSVKYDPLEAVGNISPNFFASVKQQDSPAKSRGIDSKMILLKRRTELFYINIRALNPSAEYIQSYISVNYLVASGYIDAANPIALYLRGLLPQLITKEKVLDVAFQTQNTPAVLLLNLELKLIEFIRNIFTKSHINKSAILQRQMTNLRMVFSPIEFFLVPQAPHASDSPFSFPHTPPPYQLLIFDCLDFVHILPKEALPLAECLSGRISMADTATILFSKITDKTIKEKKIIDLSTVIQNHLQTQFKPLKSNIIFNYIQNIFTPLLEIQPVQTLPLKSKPVFHDQLSPAPAYCSTDYECSMPYQAANPYENKQRINFIAEHLGCTPKDAEKMTQPIEEYIYSLPIQITVKDTDWLNEEGELKHGLFYQSMPARMAHEVPISSIIKAGCDSVSICGEEITSLQLPNWSEDELLRERNAAYLPWRVSKDNKAFHRKLAFTDIPVFGALCFWDPQQALSGGENCYGNVHIRLRNNFARNNPGRVFWNAKVGGIACSSPLLLFDQLILYNDKMAIQLLANTVGQKLEYTLTPDVNSGIEVMILGGIDFAKDVIDSIILSKCEGQDRTPSTFNPKVFKKAFHCKKVIEDTSPRPDTGWNMENDLILLRQQAVRILQAKVNAKVIKFEDNINKVLFQKIPLYQIFKQIVNILKTKTEAKTDIDIAITRLNDNIKLSEANAIIQSLMWQ